MGVFGGKLERKLSKLSDRYKVKTINRLMVLNVIYSKFI